MTDHAEVIRVRYDSSRISFGQILKVFFAVAHDPTHVNRQGNDIGRQYRSAIFYADDEQRRVAEAYHQAADGREGVRLADRHDARAARAVLRGRGLSPGFRGQEPGQPYVAAVAMPKVKKLEKAFKDRLKGSRCR